MVLQATSTVINGATELLVPCSFEKFIFIDFPRSEKSIFMQEIITYFCCEGEQHVAS